jgi:hypothetical protein
LRRIDFNVPSFCITGLKILNSPSPAENSPRNKIFKKMPELRLVGHILERTIFARPVKTPPQDIFEKF